MGSGIAFAQKLEMCWIRYSMANFKKAYIEKHKAAIQKELGLANVMEIPKMEKITVNMGLGEALQNSKLIESGVDQIKVITGQAPVVTLSLIHI